MDEDEDLAMRKVYRDTHKRNLRPSTSGASATRGNVTDGTQWAVLTRSKQVRFLVVILEQSFLFDEARCSSALFLEHVVSLCLSSSSDEHHLSHRLFGHKHTGWDPKHLCYYRAIFGQSHPRHFSVLCVFASATFLVCW